ncbi:hypothetical protein EWH13_36590, partial [Bradyrhizobium elkanii]
MTDGKSQDELTQLADEALRAQPGCETARVPAVAALPDAQIGIARRSGSEERGDQDGESVSRRDDDRRDDCR